MLVELHIRAPLQLFMLFHVKSVIIVVVAPFLGAKVCLSSCLATQLLVHRLSCIGRHYRWQVD